MYLFIYLYTYLFNNVITYTCINPRLPKLFLKIKSPEGGEGDRIIFLTKAALIVFVKKKLCSKQHMPVLRQTQELVKTLILNRERDMKIEWP